MGRRLRRSDGKGAVPRVCAQAPGPSPQACPTQFAVPPHLGKVGDAGAGFTSAGWVRNQALHLEIQYRAALGGLHQMGGSGQTALLMTLSRHSMGADIVDLPSGGGVEGGAQGGTIGRTTSGPTTLHRGKAWEPVAATPNSLYGPPNLVEAPILGDTICPGQPRASPALTACIDKLQNNWN